MQNGSNDSKMAQKSLTSSNTRKKLINLMLSDNFKMLDTLFNGVTESPKLAKFMILIAL